MTAIRASHRDLLANNQIAIVAITSPDGTPQMTRNSTQHD
jgi:hypothetical protein